MIKGITNGITYRAGSRGLQAGRASIQPTKARWAPMALFLEWGCNEVAVSSPSGMQSTVERSAFPLFPE